MSNGTYGMWVAPEDDPREEIPDGHGEKGVLGEYLDHHRMTLQMKCEGLTPEQFASRSVPPSNLSLLGLLRHLANMEEHWFRRVLEGRPDLPPMYDEGLEDPEFDGAVAEESVVKQAWTDWRREVAHAREAYAGLDIDTYAHLDGDRIEVRDIIVHLIAEYARHIGHADLLRECIDGRTGV